MKLRLLGSMLLVILAGFLYASGLSTAGATGFSSSKYQLFGGIVDKSSPTLADVNGDGCLEVLIGTTRCQGNPCNYTGKGYCWHSKGMERHYGTRM